MNHLIFSSKSLISVFFGFAIFFGFHSCSFDKNEIPTPKPPPSDCNTVSKKHLIEVLDFRFSPENITAQIGDTIEWVWKEGDHTTTSKAEIPAGADSWNAIIDKNNTNFIYILKTEGSYNYVCTPHAPTMSGKITVIKKTC